METGLSSLWSGSPLGVNVSGTLRSVLRFIGGGGLRMGCSLFTQTHITFIPIVASWKIQLELISHAGKFQELFLVQQINVDY